MIDQSTPRRGNDALMLLKSGYIVPSTFNELLQRGLDEQTARRYTTKYVQKAITLRKNRLGDEVQ